MKNKLQKFLSLLLVLCTAISVWGGQSGTFKKGGTWKYDVSTGELYIDAEVIPDYKITSTSSHMRVDLSAFGYGSDRIRKKKCRDKCSLV